MNDTLDAEEPRSGPATDEAAADGDAESTLPRPRTGLAMKVVIPVAVALIALIVILARSESGLDRQSSTELVGEFAPRIVGVTMSGDTFDIDEHRGRWVVVNFFASWCTPCRVEHPELVEFDGRHADGDALIVSVAFDDQPEEVIEFFEDFGGDWDVLVRDTGPVALEYGVVRLPESYLVAPNGLVVEKFIGGVTADGLDAAIARFQPEVVG